jgi:hypothetical protein
MLIYNFLNQKLLGLQSASTDQILAIFMTVIRVSESHFLVITRNL